jgi:hypothetical protein
MADPVTLDFSNAIPIGAPIDASQPADAQAGALQGAIAYGATQDPDQYANLLKLQKQTGVPPAVSNGNQQQVRQAAAVHSIDYPKFLATFPRTAEWVSNPDNAAVSGVDEVQRLGGIEQNRASMGARTPTWSENAGDKLLALGQWMMGGAISREQLRQNFWEGPLTRGAADIAGGAAGMVGNVGSFLGWHGDGASKQNLLQRIESNLDPANAGVYANGEADTGNQFDWLMKNVAPMIPAVLATGGTGLVARTLGIGQTAAKVLTGLTVGGMFDADQAGKTYTAVAGSGAGDYAARLAANRVATISALPNAAFGATDVVPLLRDNPLLTSLGLGGATGATGQIGQNVVTGQPWAKGVPAAMVQGAAMQAGMHLGLSGGFAANLSDAVEAAEQSKLRARSPEKFNEAMQTIFAGDQSLRVPVDQFNSYFNGKGMDPGAVAAGLGAANYAEAHLSGGDVEIPPADFLSKLDPEHQKALLGDIVDPSTGLTARQHQEGLQELEQWATGGGAAKLAADTAAADAETAATPEYQEVKEQIRQRYTDAGETPEVAETLATKDANAYSNLARNAGMKPSELLNLYNPKVTVGEAPETGGNDMSAHVNTAANPIEFKAPEFTTAKGSVYKVNEDGTTTRDKAFRPEHGGAEQGPQPTSERTFYVTPEDANKLGEFQTRGAGSKSISAVDAGRVGVRYEEGKDAGKFEKRTVVGVQSSPSLGLVPVELWEGGKKVHFGNEITEVSGALTGHDGKATTLLTSARELPAKYRLVEADSLVPSHDAHTFAKNPAYPEGLQERAYDTSKEAQARVIQQAQNYDPRYTVNTNPDAVNGPPVVTPDGTVLGGNSRAMSTQRLYEKDGSAYKAALKEQAATYGFTPEQVEAMKKPVLVRQVETPATPDDARRLGSELNKSMTGAMGVSERAVSAGKNLKQDTLRNIAGMMQADDSTLREAMAKHGAGIVKMLTSDGVITDRERPQFVDAASGGLSEEGKTFVERALMGSVIDDPRLMDSAPKSVINKLERSLGSIASFASRPDEWNLLPAIRDAVGELGAIQRSGSTVDLRLGQTSMFDGERNPLVDAMIRALDAKPNDVRKSFDEFARDSDANLPGQGRMFGEANAFDAFNHAFGSKLSEQEYHDGLEEAAAKAPDTSAGADAQGNEGVPRSSDQNAAHGGQAGASLNQSSEDGPRGWFRVLPDGTYEIGKTKIGDLSTFVHEPAHAYLKILGDLSKRDGASDTLKSDYQKVLDFLGAKDGEPLTREQQETWARANEQYLREGKAPSAGLKGAFQRFAIWLGSVYKKASDLGVNLSDEIRGVFDRLYAAEDGVNRAETEAGPKLFTSAEDAGWTDEQFQKYASDNNMSVEQAKSDILGRLNEAAVRARSESWRNEEQNVREAVTADVDQRPEYSAIRALRRGALDDGTELTLSREDLAKQFGEERVKELQRLHPGLYRNEGGEDPEIVAEVFGFHSAEEMMRALEVAPRRSAAIETATRGYMTAKHGDIRYDGTLDDQARIALENDNRAKGLHAELMALKQKVSGMTGEREALRAIEVAPIASYREAAQQMVEKKSVADLQPTRYLDASRKYSREAFEALQKGDAQAAANAKHKELMNHFLFREATEARQYIGKFEAYAKRMQKTAAQQKLGLAGGDYRDQFNRILGRYGLGPQVAPGERSLGEWAASEYEQGKEPAIDAGILNEARTVNYRNAPVAEIRAVHDALINIRKLASLELGMEVNGKRVEFSAAIANMEAQAHESLPAKPTRVLKGNATLGEKIADYAQRGDALLMRTERLIEWLDGGKTGPWHDNLWNLAADSQGNEYKLQEQVTEQLGDAIENLPKEQRAKMFEKTTVDGIPETVTRHDLVSMAFNMGNDGNLDRLQKTFAAHGWDPDAIHRIAGMLTREEWQFVQDGWNALKPLGQAQSDLERRLTGLPPVMVKPTPLDLVLQDGTKMHLDGGYYPIVMDPRYGSRGAQQDAGTTAQNLMEAGYGRAATSRGNMQARTGFGGPLQLDYEQVLTQHTAKVIKDITHREFMLAANKLLLDPQIRSTMRQSLGEGYEEKMMPWLRTIVNDRNGSAVQGLGDFSRMMRSLRTNLTLATLSYKISTSLLQWTHAPRMLLSTNPGSYAQALVDFMAHPSEMTQQIKDLSPNEMAARGDNLDRDIRAVLRGDPGIKRSVARLGNVSIKYTDHVLSFPLWLSVYRDGLKEHAGLTEDQAQNLAMHAADSAVRLGLGSAAPKDLPPIMRNNDLTKLMTMFYSFHNGIYGQVRDIGHQFRQNGGAGSPSAVGKLSYGLALSVLAPALLGGIVSGNGPKDGENKGLWAAKRALLFAADTVPGLRDAASALESDGEVKNPLMNVLSKGTKATQEMMSGSDDKDWKGIGLNYLEVGGDLAGLPGTTQAMKPLRYMNQVQRGNVESPNVWDAVAGSARR